MLKRVYRKLKRLITPSLTSAAPLVETPATKTDYVRGSYGECVMEDYSLITLEGGLGDTIMMTPYIKVLKQNIKRPLKVIYRNQQNVVGNPEMFSVLQTRLFTDGTGKRINPQQEYLENCQFIDFLEGKDAYIHYTDPGYWWTKGVIEQSRDFTPQIYRKWVFNDIFIPEDEQRARDFLSTIDIRGRKLVGLHLRRNADKIAEIYEALSKSHDDLLFLAFGSTEHENIPDILSRDNVVSLVNSYEKGIGLRTLFQIGMKLDLYIGGRGGFEAFFWIAGVPSLNIFDDDGLYEYFWGLWPASMWQENSIKRIYHTADLNQAILAEIEDYFARHGQRSFPLLQP